LKKLNKEDIQSILENRFVDDKILSLKDLPRAFELKDMDKAVDRIIKAIDNNEKIVLVGDYDVDGVTSRVIIEEFFVYIGAEIKSITPNRFKDGYGLSKNLIKDIKADVIITVDNGITSYEAGEYCRENNIDLIITDHHIASKLPEAYAIVNPKQSDCTFAFKEICGAQVAWYLIAGLKERLQVDFDMTSILDILLLAIVADVMPLVSMNRVLVKKAIKVFSASQRPAMIAIKEALSRDIITSEDIGFAIAPKINVAGRLEDAILAVEFLQSKDINIAIERFTYLSELNMERKQIQQYVYKQSCLIYEAQENKGDVIVSVSEDFNAGVIGIVASKLAEKYKKMAFVGVIDTNTNKIKMSGRSYGGVNLYDLLVYCKDNIDSFGGHKEAGGLNLDINKLDIFKEQINQVFKNNFVFREENNIFGILDIKDVDFELIGLLNSFEPYGHKNERPIFLFEKVYIDNALKIGADKRTMKLSINTPEGILSAIKFDSDDDIDMIKNNYINIVASVGINEFRGNVSLQLMIKEIEY
jgi:single-stranded-DNA-specific exonuclease